DPVILMGGEEFGAPYLLDALKQKCRVAWFELGPRTRQDPVAQRNELARAVNATLPTPLLGIALPYRTQLSALRLYRTELLPLWLVGTADGAAGGLPEDLLALRHHGSTLIIDRRGEQKPPPALAARAQVLGPDQLRLNLQEASD